MMIYLINHDTLLCPIYALCVSVYTEQTLYLFRIDSIPKSAVLHVLIQHVLLLPAAASMLCAFT